jgi:tRNA (cytidine/uridine-2'-O-)-methyltransferase
MKHAHSRKADFDFYWPAPPLNVVLVNPEIPPNTGNIARLCAATGTRLHLVEPLGFAIDDAQLRRAGLDYWDAVQVQVHPSWTACIEALRPSRLFLYSTGSSRRYDQAEYRPGDTLVFGCETKGLPDEMLAAHAPDVRGIPIRTEHVRSLNLSSAVAVVVYEALRQLDAQSARPARG